MLDVAKHTSKLERLVAVSALLLAASACGGTTTTPTTNETSEPPPSSSAPAGSDDTAAPSSTSTSSPPAPPTTPSVPDGTPERVTCTSSLGNALSTMHGRLDGYLVSFVPMGSRDCNGDSSHLHLQVKMADKVYDVAVNLDVLEANVTATALPGGAWSEGWHTDKPLDYPKDLALHAAAFTAASPSARASELKTKLANANHVSIFATGYGKDGAHLIHRQGDSHDGAIVLDPLSNQPHVIAFRFSTDSF